MQVDSNYIFVPFNVPSSKNSKVATSRGVFHSKTVKKYLQKLGIQNYSVSKKIVKEYVNRPNIFRKCFEEFPKLLANKTPPYEIGIHFIRDSKRAFDFHNATQIVADLMVAHDFIEDDNMNYFIPIPIKEDDEYYTVDKETAGVLIKVL